ncbi:methyltransferase domain-containing protein [Saccharibacter sp. 17.LH.SD]|uniref:methyltransferase n=1 Tax=Saccharibacter sp. 17.LH.SD TaxID=2689393 RepID=UPI00136FBD64|nr:methyltransferase [Saccharibacter sp. 17.LH.SD]MXV43693.1 methyltransferase domain-containing protein [Saccharibacter sp. 17.LH.SD]
MTDHRKSSIRDRFNSAIHYDQAARVQKRCATHLAQDSYTYCAPSPPQRILELGCGTGFLTSELRHLFPNASICATDLSPDMLKRTDERLGSSPNVFLRIMDGEFPHTDWPSSHHPPFDLITSSLCWQWFTDRPAALKRLIPLLAPGGCFVIATLVQDSLKEWRESCLATHIPCGVPDYPSLKLLNQEWPLDGTGLWEEHLLTDPVPSARHFLRDLRRIGATLPQNSYLPTRGLGLKQAMQWFDDHHHAVTYHIGFGFFRKNV